MTKTKNDDVLDALVSEIEASMHVAGAAIEAGFSAATYDPEHFEEAIGALDRAKTAMARYRKLRRQSELGRRGRDV